jgi:hypothetical protein
MHPSIIITDYSKIQGYYIELNAKDEMVPCEIQVYLLLNPNTPKLFFDPLDLKKPSKEFPKSLHTLYVKAMDI